MARLSVRAGPFGAPETLADAEAVRRGDAVGGIARSGLSGGEHAEGLRVRRWKMRFIQKKTSVVLQGP
jgi:hypothetical protein